MVLGANDEYGQTKVVLGDEEFGHTQVVLGDEELGHTKVVLGDEEQGHTRHDCHGMPPCTRSINLSKVAGALHKPNGITVN